MADRIVVIRAGLVVETGDFDVLHDNSPDEYTQRLIESVPKLELETYPESR